jgi:hypothetical protein
MKRSLIWLVAAAATAAVLFVPAALASHGGDTLVTVGSPPSPFPQNKQNEPAVAINPIVPNLVAAGANDEIDLEACNNRADNTCPFTAGVGVSGVYFSLNSGDTWHQPTYSGWTARDCLGVVGTQPNNPADNCDPHVGPIGTLPRYFESGLVADGDPAVAFGPKPGPNGFHWSNGWRLYYANLTSNFSSLRAEFAISGFEAIAVSRLDDVSLPAAMAGSNTAWQAPMIASKQNAALFSDHEQIAVDDAESSPFFGNVYVCDAAFRSQENSPNSLPEPIQLNVSSDGGDTWMTRQLSAAVNNIVVGGRQDCQVDTDSNGVVYVFWDGTDTQTRQLAIFMIRSFDGGKTFERPARVVTLVTPTGLFDPNSGSRTMDGIGGARDGVTPSISIANGAPTGAGAPNWIALTYANGPTPSDVNPGPNETAPVWLGKPTPATVSWTGPVQGAVASDRPLYPAVAISPDGRDVYLTYDSFLQPWQSTTANPRLMQGVVRHADVSASGALGGFTTLHRAPAGDARGSSQNNLDAGFLGDYNYAFATNTFGVAVWNDVRFAADCPAIDAYRQALYAFLTGASSTQPTRPAPNNDCPARFGNTDIFGGSYADPTAP